jgi:hypothetical protein
MCLDAINRQANGQDWPMWTFDVQKAAGREVRIFKDYIVSMPDL